MFGCQKPEAASSDQTPVADATPEGPGTASTANHEPTMRITGEGSNSGQPLTDNRQLPLPEGKSSNLNGQPSSARPWSMSVPALRSSISFANALPPIPTELATQQQQQQPTFTDDVFYPESERHKSPHPQENASGAVSHTPPAVDASVSEWLLQQINGKLQRSFCDGGDSIVEVTTAGAEQGEASASSRATDAEAMGLQVRNMWLGLSLSSKVRHMRIRCRLQSQSHLVLHPGARLRANRRIFVRDSPSTQVGDPQLTTSAQLTCSRLSHIALRSMKVE